MSRECNTKNEDYIAGFDDGERSVLTPTAKRIKEYIINDYELYRKGYRAGLRKGNVVFWLAAIFAIICTTLIIVFVWPYIK